jgi:hypothetical protein
MDEQVKEAVPPCGMRIANCVQQSVVIVFLLGAVVPLLTAAITTGDYAGLLDPRLERFGDPKDAVAVLGGAWNPLKWVSQVAVAVSAYIALPALLAGGMGLMYLPRPDVRVHRRTFIVLAIGTALCFLLVALMLTPYGARLQNWLLD